VFALASLLFSFLPFVCPVEGTQKISAPDLTPCNKPRPPRVCSPSPIMFRVVHPKITDSICGARLLTVSVRSITCRVVRIKSTSITFSGFFVGGSYMLFLFMSPLVVSLMFCTVVVMQTGSSLLVYCLCSNKQGSCRRRRHFPSKE
jgi:hypothetical protein